MNYSIKNIERSTGQVVASEEWSSIFRLHRRSFSKLLAVERKLETSFETYFEQLADRIIYFVDWHEVQRRMENVMLSEVVVSINDRLFDLEARFMLNLTLDNFVEGMTAGAEAQEFLTGFTVGTDRLSETMGERANREMLGLSRTLNRTTRRHLKRVLTKSILLGENTDTMVERMRTTINNPIRARLIARTESVRSWNSGVYGFGVESKAKEKEWQSVQLGACPICQELDGERVELDEEFKSDLGTFAYPPAHPNCRCGIVLTYD